MEFSDVLNTLEKFWVHSKSNKSFIISALSTDDPMFEIGMNHEKYDNFLKISAVIPGLTIYLTLQLGLQIDVGIVNDIMIKVHPRINGIFRNL